MRSKVVGTVLLGLILATGAMAQQGTGDSEFQAQGTLSLATSGKGNNTGGASVLLGRFFTDHQEAGAQLMATIIGQDKVTVVGSGGLFYRYNFSTGQVVPYVGLAANGSFSGGDKTIQSSSGLLFTAEAGFRYFVDRRTAFSVEAMEGYSSKEKEFNKQLTVLFGFSHLWGK